MISYHTSTAHKSEELTVDERFSDVVKRFYQAYTKTVIIDNLLSESTTVHWHCYECMKQISVDISPILRNKTFYGTSLFCKEHKPTNYKHLHTFLFVRYENSFFNSIKSSLLSDTISP